MFHQTCGRLQKLSAEVHGAGGYRTVHTVADLAGMLLSDSWPKKAGDLSFQSALSACLQALEFQADGAKTRRAFVECRSKAGITVMLDDEARH